MTDGTVRVEDVIAFYNGQLGRMSQYETRGNGRLEWVKKSLAEFIKPGMSVLDIGCGTGVTSRHMAALGANVTGMDISPALIEYAKSQPSLREIKYIVQDVADIDLNQAFDAIVMADVFEHIQRQDVFMVVRRLLRYHVNDNAYLYINMPNFSFSRFMNKRYPDKLQIVDEAWSIEDVVSLFSYLGFSPLSLRMYGMDVQAQYIEYLFINTEFLNRMYEEKLEKIYKQGGKYEFTEERIGQAA